MEWINIDDLYPDDFQDVIVCDVDDTVFLAQYKNNDFYTVGYGGLEYICGKDEGYPMITHWMPLPSPPKNK